MVSAIGSYNAYNNIMSSQNTQKPEQTSGKKFVVFMPDEDTLYTGGNGTGLSFKIKEAENSTEENPIMTAKGVDENGNEFEKNIEINKINPENATLVEMRALEAYLGADKGGGLSSLPMDTGDMGLNDRVNFMNMFDDTIKTQNTLGQSKKANFYTNNRSVYSDFAYNNSNSETSLAQNLFSKLGQSTQNLAANYIQNLIGQYI